MKHHETKMYVALDGDGVGSKLSQLIKEGAPDLAISTFATGVQNEMFAFADLVRELGAEVLMCSGDSVLYTIKPNKVNHSLSLLNVSFCTYTIGVGRNVIEAHKCLNFGKMNGKNQVYWFTKGITAKILFKMVCNPFATAKYLFH